MRLAPGMPLRRRIPFDLAVWRSLPALVCVLLLLDGCTGAADWLHGFVGGEGKVAELVAPSVLDEPPIPETTPAEPETAAVPLTKEEIVVVQRDLARLGYRPGPDDGFVGPLTVEAVKAYQLDAGRVPDGRITPEFMEMLAADAAPEPATSRISTARNGENAAAAPAAQREATASPPEAVRPEPRETAVVDAQRRHETMPEPNAPPEAQPKTDVVSVEYAQLPPLYEVGDTYIWSNGRVEAVFRVFRDKVFWQVDNGMGYAADRNFLIPPASWSGPLGAGEAVVQPDMAGFWPLRPQSSMTFAVVENGLRESWDCGVSGLERVSVPAGRFDSVVLSCIRDRAPPGEWTRRVWHYVPAIRHYVARNDFMPDGTRRSKELLGVRPGADGWPPALKAGLDKAVQTVLDTLPAGEVSRWASTGVAETFEIRPGPVQYGEGQVRCRNFELVARDEGPARLFPAVACQSGEGEKWTIPGDRRELVRDFSFANFGE